MILRKINSVVAGDIVQMEPYLEWHMILKLLMKIDILI